MYINKVLSLLMKYFQKFPMSGGRTEIKYPDNDMDFEDLDPIEAGVFACI